ncbi:globin domain-containing protein [Streptomyces gamaensis]|uniref:nitric oxide dioxygenase n=1 Tax=Streptomyces gamaensis TaxID=1763542 RepID=A0ABW0Z5L4_9ACTN
MPRPSPVGAEYHALLARHEAMRLRRQLLSPGQSPGTPAGHNPTAGNRDGSYDGAADQRVITEHLALVTPFGELITHLYDAMFERWPSLRSLFPESMEFQRAHLAKVFWYLVENLHRPQDVAEQFFRLGRDHRKLGVRPAHYRAFEAALREALRRTAGERWSAEAEEAWIRMLRFAVAAMVRGADAAVGEPASWQATVTSHELRRPDLAVLRVRAHEPYPWRAGQYAAVESPRLPQAWRQYTIARAPRPGGELEFHVRRTGSGGVSEALVAHTRAGDTLRLGPAQGTTTLDDDLTRDVLLVCGGTGWATGKALLDELAARRTPVRSVLLILAARGAEELYDADWAASLERRRPWLRVVPVLGTGESGALADALARHGDLSGHQALVSGPPGMVTAVVSRLTSLHALPVDRLRHDPLPDTLSPTAHRAAAFEEARQ